MDALHGRGEVTARIFAPGKICAAAVMTVWACGVAAEADALYVSGTPMPFIENIEPQEIELRKLVAGALPAMIWNCLETLKVRVTIG